MDGRGGKEVSGVEVKRVWERRTLLVARVVVDLCLPCVWVKKYSAGVKYPCCS